MTTQTNWPQDIRAMHHKFGVREVVETLPPEKLKAFLEFRFKFLQEELGEALVAKNADDVVDAMIDLCVVAIGTLDAFNVDAQEAWNRVQAANMAKEPGIKKERPNPFGFPDLIKPEGWTAPSHEDNVGWLSKVYNEED